MPIKKNIFYVVFISSIASISGILFGYDTGVISGALIFLKRDFIISPNQEGLIVSLLLFGAAFGAFLVGKVADKIGRKKVLLITSVLYIIGTIGLSQAASLNQIYIFRFILGLPIGIGSFSALNYISEIAPKSLRGMLVSIFQLALVIGILLTYTVNYFFSSTKGAWHLMFLFGLVPAILLLIGSFFLPESPRWMLENGMESKAVKVLLKLRGDNYLDELEEIKTTVKLETTNKKEWNHLFNKHNAPVLILACLIMLFQQLSGIDAIIYYAPQIFMQTGFQLDDSMVSTITIGVVNLIATIIGLLILDKVGRRKLMLSGALIMAFALGFVVLTLSSISLKYLGLFGVLLYIFAFAISTGVVGWLIIAEIFPLKVRAEGTSVAVTSFWIFNISVSFSFPILVKLISLTHIFGFFSITCFISFIFYYYYLPETNGISLETIEKNLMNNTKTRYLGKI